GPCPQGGAGSGPERPCDPPGPRCVGRVPRVAGRGAHRARLLRRGDPDRHVPPAPSRARQAIGRQVARPAPPRISEDGRMDSWNAGQSPSNSAIFWQFLHSTIPAIQSSSIPPFQLSLSLMPSPMSYTFFVATLPMLLPDTPPPLTVERFLELAREYLS